MSINDLTAMLKKKGFRDTFHILASKNYKCEKHAFYNELNKFSYYNSYFRIKDELIKRGLLEIKNNDGKKCPNCGSKLPLKANFCNECGKNI